jgi:diguanylate cyclase (GGDEF)-like protein
LLRLSRQPDVPPVADLTEYEDEANRALERGFPLMYFPPRLEALFEQETQVVRTRHLVAIGLLWIAFSVVYSLFFPAVPRTPADGVFTVDQVVRLGIITPVIVATIAAIWWGVRPLLRELLMMIACIVAPASIIVVVTITQDGDPGTVRGALTIILLFITVVVRLRFWFATLACLALVGIQVGAPALAQTQIPGHVPLVLATIAATLTANYTLEREYRLNYLHRLLARLFGGRQTAMVEQLHDLSRRDALTGLPNRRAMDSQLEELCAQNERFSVILVDVDAFKSFNDLHGHQVGDDCLRRVAAMLRASLRRTSDRVARMGGEEFAVVLPRTVLKDACTMAERMRQSVYDLRIPHLGSPPDNVVTISAGVSEARIPATPGEVLSQSDRALYQAKSEGRNRVAVDL